ncbi:MAG: hypothetical protein M1825_005704 [Sarcosagium campestre]|nr:MAG: hypothetical protein M1825_005704 [Sarcosagium campestre]
MPPASPQILFSSFQVTNQSFYRTALSFAIVNKRPLIPGHVLVSPLRPIPRLYNLTSAEVADLFATVQKVGRMVERVYGAQALNVAVQDGQAAGQSVPHVHVHIIPRKTRDDWGDQVYDDLDHWERHLNGPDREGNTTQKISGFPKIDEENRTDRSEDEMIAEATSLAQEMERELAAASLA